MSSDRIIMVRLIDEQALAEGDELREVVIYLQQEVEHDAAFLDDKPLYDFILDKSVIELRTDPVYNALIACCGSSASGEMPSTFDIASQVVAQKSCNCFFDQDVNATIRATEHALLHHSATSCYVIAQILLFHTAERHYPTVHELNQMETRLNVALDPAENEESGKRPCPGLEKLKSCKAKKHIDQGCCICQDDISRGSDMIKLTPCGHIFHDKTRDCDGIRPWLVANETCPICVKKVELI